MQKTNTPQEIINFTINYFLHYPHKKFDFFLNPVFTRKAISLKGTRFMEINNDKFMEKQATYHDKGKHRNHNINI